MASTGLAVNGCSYLDGTLMVMTRSVMEMAYIPSTRAAARSRGMILGGGKQQAKGRLMNTAWVDPAVKKRLRQCDLDTSTTQEGPLPSLHNP